MLEVPTFILQGFGMLSMAGRRQRPDLGGKTGFRCQFHTHQPVTGPCSLSLTSSVTKRANGISSRSLSGTEVLSSQSLSS